MDIEEALKWADANSSPEAVERLRSRKVAKLLADEVRRLREDCAEAYQVCGAAMLCPGEVKWTDDDAVRVLDNLSAAANGEPRPHDDLLPWPRP